MENKNLIFTISGIRGIFGESLNDAIIKRIAIAYGLWLNNTDKRIIIGMDTRPSSKAIEDLIIDGITSVECKVINLGICPTPIIIYTKNKLNIPGGIIITGSHNPPEWNGLKLLSTKTFLEKSELDEISKMMNKINLKKYKTVKFYQSSNIKKLNSNQGYIQDLYNFISPQNLKKKNKLRIVVDNGAGAGKVATPQILEGLGCNVKLINNDLDKKKRFPREIEPVEKNLSALITTIMEGNYDVGFAHDCDADRLAIIGDDGTCYPEDTGLALITNYYFKRYKQVSKKIIFVTNLASSLMFDVLAQNFGAHIIRTPVGERFLAEKMETLIEKEDSSSIILGGEGSCGGVMIPRFNNTRDGIFAAAKIIEILVNTKEKISFLVSKLPKFYAFREYINIENKNIEHFINLLKKNLISDGEKVDQIGMDLRFGYENEWFVLIHPSNTEPMIRVISEANNENFAKKKLITTAECVKTLFSTL